jgi:hypothetical protein
MVPLAGCDSSGSDGGSDGGSIATPGDVGAGGGDGSTQGWTLVKTATDNSINDVAITADGAYAVADGGLLLKRTDAEWAVVDDGGPSSNGNDLYGLAATDDGERLWLVGASGAIGEWDVSTGSLTDYSAPDGVTNNFAAVTVTGSAGSANIQIADRSGKVLYSTDNGGTWMQVTPGSGSGLRAIDTYGPERGHVVDANQSVYETTDAGGTWGKTGVADANVAFYGVDSNAADDVWVAGGNGTLYRWDGAGWGTTDIGEPTLEDIEVAADDGSGYASGASGAVFAYDGSAWARQSTPTSENLNAVVRSTDSTPAIAVGAGGTVIER